MVDIACILALFSDLFDITDNVSIIHYPFDLLWWKMNNKYVRTQTVDLHEPADAIGARQILLPHQLCGTRCLLDVSQLEMWYHLNSSSDYPV